MARQDKISFDFQAGIILRALFGLTIKPEIALIAACLFDAYPMRSWGKFLSCGWKHVNQG
jgi:hypothetical protein